jgi:hypothetical protein
MNAVNRKARMLVLEFTYSKKAKKSKHYNIFLRALRAT